MRSLRRDVLLLGNRESLVLGFKKFFLRDFCEVEFWEVLRFSECARALVTVSPFSPADCQLANLERFLFCYLVLLLRSGY